jgi:phytoene/squalene synthetase
LQLVNILKDSDEDERAGRVFIPRDTKRADLFELAREDLREAEAYVNTLRQANAPAGFIAFTELPLHLARQTLEHLEAHGPGSKLPKGQVMDLVAHIAQGSTPHGTSTSSFRGTTAI